MENGYVDEATDEKRLQDAKLEVIKLHLGTILEFRPAPAVMDTV